MSAKETYKVQRQRAALRCSWILPNNSNGHNYFAYSYPAKDEIKIATQKALRI